jgi:hypothetical protein
LAASPMTSSRYARQVGLRVGDPGVECGHGGADPGDGVLDVVEALFGASGHKDTASASA